MPVRDLHVSTYPKPGRGWGIEIEITTKWLWIDRRKKLIGPRAHFENIFGSVAATQYNNME